MKTCQKCGTHIKKNDFCPPCFEFARAVTRATESMRMLEGQFPDIVREARLSVNDVQRRFDLSIERKEPPFVDSSQPPASLVIVRSRAAAFVALREIRLLAHIVSLMRGGNQESISLERAIRERVMKLLSGCEQNGRKPRFGDIHQVTNNARSELLKIVALKKDRLRPHKHHAPRMYGGGRHRAA